MTSAGAERIGDFGLAPESSIGVAGEGADVVEVASAATVSTGFRTRYCSGVAGAGAQTLIGDDAVWDHCMLPSVHCILETDGLGGPTPPATLGVKRGDREAPALRDDLGGRFSPLEGATAFVVSVHSAVTPAAESTLMANSSSTVLEAVSDTCWEIVSLGAKVVACAGFETRLGA